MKNWGPGIRYFHCNDCGNQWESKCRNCTSLSGEACKDCGNFCEPHDFERHDEWPVDN